MSTALLEIENLSKSFGGVHAVRNCTFSIPEGQVVGLIGPNGAGKSTVVDLVSGFGRPDSGRVMFAGEQLTGKRPDVISRLGLIRTFQTPREWRNLTVMDNVLLGRRRFADESLWRSLTRARRTRRHEEAERAVVRGILERFQLAELKNELAGKLSGGQKRLLEFARIAAAEARLIILDEPMGGVNPVLGARISEAVGHFAGEGRVDAATAGTGQDAMAGPLAGVHVLDLARVLAGPYAAMLLGDLGAEVIKVERPGTGDDTRQWGPPFVPAVGDGAESTYFLSVNRGKRSVAIDLKDPGEREFVEALVRWADVLVENFRPGVMDRLGLPDARLAELNPRLIRLSISGFGERGPDRDRVGYDQILQAEGGVMSLTGTEASQAVKVGVPIADISAALFGVIGVLGALVDRERSGLGQRVSTSLLAGQVGIHTFELMNAAFGERTVADWLGRLRLAGVPAGEVKTLDRVYESEQARAEDLVWEVEHPRLGGIRLPGHPVHYSRTAVAPGLPPPGLGEHTDELRAALLRPAQADGG